MSPCSPTRKMQPRRHENTKKNLAVAFILIGITGTVIGSVRLQPDGRDQAAVRGKAIYLKVGCYQCHGRSGQGSPATGPKLGPTPPPLEAFTRYLRQPRGEMPPYSARVLRDQEIADIHAFLRSVPRPPAVASLPFDK
jgi:mono/diheme cytochrome c family protein